MKSSIFLILILFQINSMPNFEDTKRDLQETKSKDIVILHTNDVHCGVRDTIGYDGLMLYKKQLQKKYENVFLVDAGDHIQGGTIGVITGGEGIIDIMNEMGYEVATLGNHEFDYGIPQLEDCEKKLNCSYISANYCFHKNKTCIYEPYKIIEKNGKKIGFIGVATPQTLSKTYLISILDSDGNQVYDFLTENKSKELYERIQKHIDELRNVEKVDYVIILGHLGIYGDALEENSSAGVVKNLEGVDAFIDGHSHKVYSQETPDKNDKNVKLAQTGTKLANIGVLIIHENGTLSHHNIDKVPYDPELASETLNVTRGKKEVYVDKNMNKFISDQIDMFSILLEIVFGYTPFPLTVYKNASESLESHTQLSRTGENALCNLVCDSFRKAGDAEVTIMNAGTVRSDINEGNITFQDIIDTMPFSNDVLVKQITGQTILDALEFGVRSLPEPTSRFPQVSGITFKIDSSINSTVEVDENEMFKSVKGERRVYDVKVNGKDVDVNKNYTISSHSFILDGGDGYSMFTSCPIIKTAVGSDNEVFMNYIIEDLKGVIPSKYKQPEGRIKITNGTIQDQKQNHITLFGLYNLNMTDSFINFYTQFISSDSSIFPKILNLTSILTTKSRLRALEELTKPANCEMDPTSSNKRVSYLCEIQANSSEISNIQILLDNPFNDSTIDYAISPLAEQYINNLENIPINDDSYNALFDSDRYEIYMLENSSFSKNSKTSFNILGQIEDTNGKEHPIYNNNSLINLNVTHLPKKMESQECLITYLSEDKYNLDCQLNQNGNYDLKGAYSLADDNLLFVNFEDSNTQMLTGNKKYYKKSSGKLSGGAIAAIIIVPIVALAATIGLVMFLKKSGATQINEVPNMSPSLDNLNSSTKIQK